jgi:hypothetical protein
MWDDKEQKLLFSGGTIMKKLISIALVLTLVLTLTACGGNKKAIVGAWRLVDETTETTYGLGLEFKKDGTLIYGITADLLSELSEDDMSEKEWEESLESMSYLMKIEYKIKSDTEMEIKASALFGLVSEKTTVPYSLDGDTLEFDGATYTRVKG